MHFRIKPVASGILLLSSFLHTTLTVTAQQNINDWARLNSVPVGSKLSVELKGGKTAKGEFSAVSNEVLTVRVKNALTEFRRDDVLRVHQVVKKSAAKSTLIGLGVGAGAGAVIGIAGDASNQGLEQVDNAATAAITVLGAAAGALTGYLVGRNNSKRILIYEAQ